MLDGRRSKLFLILFRLQQQMSTRRLCLSYWNRLEPFDPFLGPQKYHVPVVRVMRPIDEPMPDDPSFGFRNLENLLRAQRGSELLTTTYYRRTPLLRTISKSVHRQHLYKSSLCGNDPTTCTILFTVCGTVYGLIRCRILD